MDDDDLRRGKPTSHKVFGEAVAVLAGDALLTRAFAVMADVPRDWDAPRLRRRIAATAILAEASGTGGLIGGQVEDLESEGRDDRRGRAGAPPSREDRRAAGRLRARGRRARGRRRRRPRARSGGTRQAIGLAFQVVDDILDETETAEQLGKTAGKDDAAAKATYVRVHGVEEARRIASDLLAQAEASLGGPRRAGRALRELARRIVRRRG